MLSHERTIYVNVLVVFEEQQFQMCKEIVVATTTECRVAMAVFFFHSYLLLIGSWWPVLL